MIILISGATHSGKTAYAQRLMEKLYISYISQDHIKMGLIRSGYIKISQDLEAMLKLALHIKKKGSIYILDEPTTGLHAADIEKVVDILETIVDRGNTVIVIEHNTDLMKLADYIIDVTGWRFLRW